METSIELEIETELDCKIYLSIYLVFSQRGNNKGGRNVVHEKKEVLKAKPRRKEFKMQKLGSERKVTHKLLFYFLLSHFRNKQKINRK